MKSLKEYLVKESNCGGYTSNDYEEVGQTLINSYEGDKIENEDDLDKYMDKDGWYIFDLDYAADELDIDTGDLEDYLDNYFDDVKQYIIDNLPIG